MRVPPIAAATLVLAGVAACTSGNVFDLPVGTCYEQPDEEAEEVADVDIVDCDEPHTFEVYHAFDLPDGDFPGDAAIEEAFVEGCLDAFEPFVGTPYETSTVDIAPLFPTEASWRRGDREILCSAYLLDGTPHTGTFAGSNL